MALFDISPQDRQDALNMGILQAGLGMLMNNRSANPLQALGAGGLMGLQGYQGALQDTYRNKMRSLQAQEMERKMLDDQRRAETVNNFASGLDESERTRFMLDPSAYIKDMTESKVVSPGATLVRGGKSVFSQPKEAKTTIESLALPNGRWQDYYATDGLVDTTRPVGSQYAKRATASETNIGPTKIQFEGEKEQAKAYGKQLGDLRANIATNAFNAPAKLAQLDRMEQLLQGVEGGKLSPAGLEIASALNSMGVKVDPRLGNKEAAESLSREIAGSFRQPGSGPMTDKDFENFLKRVPDLSKSAEGRKQIITTMRSALRRDIQAHKLASAYAKKSGGNIDDGFAEELANFYAQNPVVPEVSAGEFRIIGVR